jgi:hypothetical protein
MKLTVARQLFVQHNVLFCVNATHRQADRRKEDSRTWSALREVFPAASRTHKLLYMALTAALAENHTKRTQNSLLSHPIVLRATDRPLF